VGGRWTPDAAAGPARRAVRPQAGSLAALQRGRPDLLAMVECPGHRDDPMGTGPARSAHVLRGCGRRTGPGAFGDGPAVSFPRRRGAVEEAAAVDPDHHRLAGLRSTVPDQTLR
jgi:hypothetical protein